jgi:hypothetical protein
MERRGHQFFEDTLRLARVMDHQLSRVQKEFEDRVISATPAETSKSCRLIDWLIDQTSASGRRLPPG